MNPDRKTEQEMQRVIEIGQRHHTEEGVKVALSRKDRDNIANLCHKVTRDIRYYQVEGEMHGKKVEVVLEFT